MCEIGDKRKSDRAVESYHCHGGGRRTCQEVVNNPPGQSCIQGGDRKGVRIDDFREKRSDALIVCMSF